MDRIRSCKYTGLLTCGGHSVDIGCLLCECLILFNLFSALICCKKCAQRGLRCNYNIGNTHQGICTSGKYGKLQIGTVFVLQTLAVLLAEEGDLCTLGSADPVGLDLLGLFRPVELRQAIEKFLRVSSDLEEPLCHVLMLDLSVAALTSTIDDLLVSKYGITLRTPVYRSILSVSQTLLEES